MIRKLGGIAAGIAIAIAIIMTVDAIGHRLFGIGLGPDGAAPATAVFPTGVLVSSLFGWFLGTLAGGYAAITVSRSGWTAWAVAGAILIAVVANFASEPHPAWMIFGGIVAPSLAGWIAQLLPRAHRF